MTTVIDPIVIRHHPDGIEDPSLWLMCRNCDEVLCEVEANDELGVLLRIAVSHTCSPVYWAHDDGEPCRPDHENDRHQTECEHNYVLHERYRHTAPTRPTGSASTQFPGPV